MPAESLTEGECRRVSPLSVAGTGERTQGPEQVREKTVESGFGALIPQETGEETGRRHSRAGRRDPEASGLCTVPLNSPAHPRDSPGPLRLHPQNGQPARLCCPGPPSPRVPDPTSPAGPLPPGGAVPSGTGSGRSRGPCPPGPQLFPAGPESTAPCPGRMGESRASAQIGPSQPRRAQDLASSGPAPPRLPRPLQPLAAHWKGREVVMDLTEDCVI